MPWFLGTIHFGAVWCAFNTAIGVEFVEVMVGSSNLESGTDEMENENTKGHNSHELNEFL